MTDFGVSGARRSGAVRTSFSPGKADFNTRAFFLHCLDIVAECAVLAAVSLAPVPVALPILGPFVGMADRPGAGTGVSDRPDPEWSGKHVTYGVFEWVGSQKLYSEHVSFTPEPGLEMR